MKNNTTDGAGRCGFVCFIQHGTPDEEQCNRWERMGLYAVIVCVIQCGTPYQKQPR